VSRAPSAQHALALPSWQRGSWPEPTTQAQTWLVVAGAEAGPGQELLASLEAELRAAGRGVVSLRANVADAAFQLDHESSWRELLRRHIAAGESVGIVHAGALTAAPLAELEPGSLAAAQRSGSLSVLALLRALQSEGSRARLLVLATGLADVSGSEPQRPEHAPLSGLCRSVRHESREIACSLLDVDIGGEPSALATGILREAFGSGSEPLVAQRGVRRWLPGVAALTLPEHGRASLLREQGVYVISGGLGGVGLALAESLARRVRARLVLFGRRCAPERERELAAQLAPLGSELLCLAADVTKPAELAALRQAALERFGVIHGIVHAAGTDGGGLLQRLSAEQWLGELSVKLDGALLLDRTFAGDALDFVAYTSSLTAFSGGMGQAGYAAANAGLDALARAASRQGRRVLSCNFDRWQGLGMAARSDERLLAAGLAVPATTGLTRGAGQQAWLSLLDAGGELEQVLISAEPLTRLPDADLLTVAAAAPDGDPGLSSAALALADARLLGVEQRRARLAEIWQQVLGRVPLDAEQSFFEQGGESLLALAILNRVRQTFGVELGLRDFFVRPTLAGLCDAVTSHLGGANAEAGPALVALPRSPLRRGGAR
jgi:NADP-dependent 3-hydroxy acid dehydrogenase YdfG